IANGRGVAELETHAQQEGIQPLFANGCQAVEQGLTTFEELIRVLGIPHGH
ncbi:type II secretion system protein GspE, partial [Escherichia coli]|nr:type II secretion system protein GspE [Escherichia coli]